MGRFSRKCLFPVFALAGISTTLLLGLGIWRLNLEKEAAKRDIIRDRMFVAVRTASALSDGLAECQTTLIAAPETLTDQRCTGLLKGDSLFHWFVYSNSAKEENPETTDLDLQSTRMRWQAQFTEHCKGQANKDQCLELASEIVASKERHDQLTAYWGYRVFAEIREVEPRPDLYFILGRRLEEIVFADVVERHKDEIFRLLAGRRNPGWVRIGRYVLTLQGNNEEPIFIGLDAAPESADLLDYFVAKNIVTSTDYRFSVSSSDQATGDDVSAAFVDDKVGSIQVVDRRFKERLSAASAAVTKLIAWFGAVGLIVFVSLVVASRATRAIFENAEQKMNFVASVSHEFRTPLASLSLMLETLLAERLSSEERKVLYLLKMQDETARLSRLADNILTLGRLQRNAPIRSELFHVQLPMEAAILQARGQQNDQEIEIASEPTKESIELQGDPALIQIALLNLLDNAIKFSPPHGRILISVRADKNSVCYSVTDQGAGIPPKERTKIFDWFYRSGNERTREKPGTGLGLAIVREVTLRHGGKVTLHSEVGNGSQFEIHLPRINRGA